jgi:hypothetical protein
MMNPIKQHKIMQVLKNNLEIDAAAKKANELRERCNMPYLYGYDYKVELNIDELSNSELAKRGLLKHGEFGLEIRS